MPNTRSPSAQQFLDLIDDVRMEMRDYPKLNVLIDGEESGGRQIANAIRNTLDAFNSMPPPLHTTFSWYQFPSRSLLIMGTIGRLQLQVADLDDRNYYPASDGQIKIPSRQKGQLVRQSAMTKWQMFLQEARTLRISLNYREAQGGYSLASEEGMILLDDYLRGKITPVNSVDPYGAY